MCYYVLGLTSAQSGNLEACQGVYNTGVPAFRDQMKCSYNQKGSLMIRVLKHRDYCIHMIQVLFRASSTLYSLL